MILQNRVCPECKAITHFGESMYKCGDDCDFDWGRASEDPYFPLREGEKVLWIEEWGEKVIDNTPLEEMTLDGLKVEFITGAKRVEKEIPDYSGIPPFILRRLALIFEEGRVKYGERNWTRGLPTSSTMNHLIEHLMKWMENDGEEDHLAKAMWGIVCLMYTMEHHADMHDVDWSDSIMRTDGIFRATNSNP